jgi:amino acid adenylation domain-containing protein
MFAERSHTALGMEKYLSTPEPFSCCLIGDDTLLISCAEVLLKKGHHIAWIITATHSIQYWANQHSIACFDSILNIDEILKGLGIDYLFSIANGKILHEEDIKLPRKFAINYHYSVLPKYAGTYATSWAILNDEKTHGITWHVMTKEIDAGDVLKQKKFTIDKNETALTLNLKCFEHAIPIFDELVSELESEKYVLKKQDFSQRTYSRLSKRPPQNGLICWSKPAQEINKLHRALIFGNYLNQLGILKLMIGTEIFHVQELHVSKNRSITTPGTIITFSDTEMQIATTTVNVIVSKILTLEGNLISLPELIDRFKITVGYQLPIADQSFWEQLEKTAAQYVRYENYWVEVLSKITPIKESFFVGQKNNNNMSQIIATKIPQYLYAKFLLETSVNCQRHTTLLAFILVYFYKLNGCDNFTTMYTYPELELLNTRFEKHFANQLPLTSHFTPDITFQQALESTILETISLKKNQTYARDITLRYPQLAHCLDLNLISIEVVKNVEMHQPKSAPLSVIISQDGTELGIFVDSYLASLQHLSVFIENISSHILTLMADTIANPEQAISKLQFLSFSEKHKIFIEWNNTNVPIFRNNLIHQLFEEQVLKTPHHIAVVFGNKKFTFSELNQRANQLAHYLKKCNVLHGDLVAICAERSFEMVVGILAILKVGATYVPLDPKYPSARLSYMLENSKAALLLLSCPSLNHHFSKHQGHVVDLTKDIREISVQMKTDLNEKITSNYLAYVLYTSGTTGNPKGVAVSHAALANHMHWMIPKFNFTENDVFLQKTPFSFDASIWEFFAPLLCGGKLIMASSGEPDEIISLIKQHKVTVLQAVPSLLKHFLDDTEFHACASLQQVFSGGEALLPDTVNLFFKKINAKLHNLYGPTETTIQVITHSYTAPNEQFINASLIGKPINNTQAYVLDKYLNVVPIGLTGELYIGGACLAKGYINQDDLTSLRFIKNPFSKQSNSRLYKTGDTVRWLPEGVLEYIGRLDSPLKLNGFRIELREVEAVILQHKLIRECAVLIQEQIGSNNNLTGNKYLVAYYIKKLDVTCLDTKHFVNSWKTLYESEYSSSAYSSLDLKNPTTNITGWNSSYTDEPIAQEHMLEWLNNTINRIKALKPNIIVEIGSGSGLMLFNMMDSCEYYYATDFSHHAINNTNQVIKSLDYNDKISTFTCSADELPYNEFKKHYDTVIINSVTQYFPSLEYLETVIFQAVSNMKKSGKIFIGDIRDFRLLHCFHFSVHSYKQKKTTKTDVDYFALRDKELLVSPEYFVDLYKKNTDIFQVEILPKIGRANHEMNNYRYDVIIHVRKNSEQINSTVDEQNFENILDIENYIKANVVNDYIYIKYANKRIAKDYIECNMLYSVEPALNIYDYDGILSMDQITDFAKIQNFETKFFIDISCPLYIYVILIKNGNSNQKDILIEYTMTPSDKNFNWASNPLASQTRFENLFSTELKAFISTKLPSYMVPSRYVLLEKMPLNIHGKIDKNALVEPAFIRSEGYFAPRNELENQLCQIWGQVLGLPEDAIGIQDDFFALGGHSLSAFRVLSLANEAFSIKLPARTLFEYPSIEALTLFIKKAQEDPFIYQEMVSPLIALKKDGFKVPLFLIHPLGGTIFWYKALSRHLDNNRPIYAIQDPGINTSKLLFKSLEEMAASYLKTIKEIQPNGPYFLAGASFGGTVSMEMANQLLKSGEKVNFLGLMDAWPVYSEKFWEKGFLERVMLRQYERLDSQFTSQNIDNLESLLKLHLHRSLMLRNYKIPFVNIKITFFKAKELWPVFKEMVLPLNCWQPYSSQPIDIHLVPGNHETMFWEPHVQVLANKIQLSLDKVESQQPPKVIRKVSLLGT